MDQIATLISNILLGAGALGAAGYCWVLAQRLKRFNNLENGVGGAVALLSAQVDDMTRTLDLARQAAGQSSETLTALTERAEAASRMLELMLASLNDLPEADSFAQSTGAAPAAPPAAQRPVLRATRSEEAADAAWVAAAETAQPGNTPPMFLSRRVGGLGQARSKGAAA